MYVICTAILRREHHFTVGKVYQIIDGCITNDDGYTYSPLSDGTGVVKWLASWYEFRETTNFDRPLMPQNGRLKSINLFDKNKRK